MSDDTMIVIETIGTGICCLCTVIMIIAAVAI